MPGDLSLTTKLQQFMQGDLEIAEELLQQVMPRLREIASRAIRNESRNVPFTKTELINELWLMNLGKGGWNIRDQGHFYALASLAMRRILVDLARRRLAGRRGGGETALSLDCIDNKGDRFSANIRDAATIVEIGILMDKLDGQDSDAARVVDMQYFCGFTLEEIAIETGLSFKQVRIRSERGLRWLKKRLPGS